MGFTGMKTSVGAEFVLRQSKVSASLDSNGKVDSTVEVSLSWPSCVVAGGAGR